MKKSTGLKLVSLGTFLVCLTISAALVVLLSATRPVLGTMQGYKTFVLDFTKPQEVESKATWSKPDRLDVTPDGLGWDGTSKGHYDAWIESAPVAVGWSWRPVIAVTVTADVLLRSERLGFEYFSITAPTSSLFRRSFAEYLMSPGKRYRSGIRPYLWRRR